ncbi:DNA polymerase [Mycobacteroides abscessus subsp. abscessus]|uniref:DNA polymerase n=1 Tax=Mycobacteroides abscessus TaxID=36809 RepID=UPI00092A9651|nr:DNA polymerase [Mycobacteroides abscessus]SHX55540.1 DNA polymerase [Mycobacteroides abscessus subsp. abscessus]SHY07610.1 DNA polymerase [Mycobacteroides abscessus subsp. abscessus]SIC43166.1 DNA polymerase [Mycobacteroides abscessus subsp. abscessus]SID65825.1 DNA polymerase [Mycobacteroides abscessus subsp. abscessus]SIF02833.1 DNA polymerase [Mycobacteroides abscessus subsp. abscessus]
MTEGTLTFDIESHSAELMYSMSPEEFVRLIGYAWGDGEVVLTTDLEEIKHQILKARWIIGHNIHAFDLRAVFGIKSDIPLELAQQRRVYDTWTHAALVNPAPYMFTNRHGKNALANSPDKMKRWFSLDEQAHQLGVPGKTHDLKALAKEFGGFGCIPVDDERYREYLIGDVVASRVVAQELLKKGKLDDYALREQEIAARAAVISSNGLRVDVEAAKARVEELRVRREAILSELQTKYGLPTEGKSPWATTAGKEAIMAALADHGITPKSRKDWTKTSTGNLSLGGEVLTELTKGTSAEDLGKALAELKGQRSLAQLALDSTHPDGFVHPDITMLQRSGRWSTTEPGLTVWTSRGEGAVEKSYFVPDSDDEVLLELDYSNADARIVAAYSGDRKYAERFEPGADGHMINAIAAWGREVVESDPKKYRQMAKPLGHGWSYGGRPGGLVRVTGLPFTTAKKFCDGMDSTFVALVDWQNRVRDEATRGYVMNEWGRKLWVEKDRIFTQAPALKGQNGTREIVCDALLRMPPHVLRRVKAQIHDAVLFSVPRENWEACRDYLVRLMETEFQPSVGGQLVEFPVSAGPAGANWMEASHE